MNIIIVLIKLLTICVHLATALDERQHHLTVMRTSMVKTKGTLSGSIMWDQSKSPKKGREEKNLDTLKWWTKGWNSGMACRSLGRIVFRFWRFCFCRQWGFLMREGETERPVRSKGKTRPLSLCLFLWWFAVWFLQSGCLWRLDACNMPMVDYAAQALSKALLTSRLTVLHLENTCLSGKPLFTLGMPSTHHPLEVHAI